MRIRQISVTAAVVLTILAGIALPASAQSRRVISLADAVALATSQSPAGQLASGRRAGITGTARTQAQWENPVLEIRRENLGSTVQYDDFATVTLPLDISGRRNALRAALDASRKLADTDSLSTMRNFAFEAAVAWWHAWAEQSLAAVAAEQAALYQRIAAVDSIRAAEGEVAEAAAFRMQLEAQRSRHKAALAGAHAVSALARLSVLIGEEDPVRITVADGHPELETLPELEAAMAMARETNPELAAARSLERAAGMRRVAEGRSAMPELGITGGYKGISGQSTGILGITVSPPFLNANGGNRERAAGELLVASAERRLAELRVLTGVRGALEAARIIDAGSSGFDERYVARTVAVSHAAETSWEEGAASLVELLDAFRAAADARAALVQSTLDRALARLELRRIIGASAVEIP